MILSTASTLSNDISSYCFILLQNMQFESLPQSFSCSPWSRRNGSLECAIFQVYQGLKFLLHYFADGKSMNTKKIRYLTQRRRWSCCKGTERLPHSYVYCWRVLSLLSKNWVCSCSFSRYLGFVQNNLFCFILWFCYIPHTSIGAQDPKEINIHIPSNNFSRLTFSASLLFFMSSLFWVWQWQRELQT